MVSNGFYFFQGGFRSSTFRSNTSILIIHLLSSNHMDNEKNNISSKCKELKFFFLNLFYCIIRVANIIRLPLKIIFFVLKT